MKKSAKKLIIEILDNTYEELSDTNFITIEEDISEKDAEEIESTFMSVRNLIAGFDWDGEFREYETYNIKD